MIFPKMTLSETRIDKICQSLRAANFRQSLCRIRGEKSENSGKTKKSRGFLLCFFPACTLPQVLCQPETYCSGATVLTQAAPANDAVPERNTASSNEQKKRTPVWFATCGAADAW